MIEYKPYHTTPSLRRKRPLKYRIMQYRWEVIIPLILLIIGLGIVALMQLPTPMC